MTLPRGPATVNFDKQNDPKSSDSVRDRSFFMREGGLVGFEGGALEKNWLERGGQQKKNEGKGGGRTKKFD